MTKKLLPLTLLLTLGFIWGTGYSIAKYATTHGVPPFAYSFWQSLGPAAFLSLLCRSQQTRTTINYISHWKYYLIAGLTGIALPNTNMYFAAQHVPAGLLAVIVNTVPIIAYPMALIGRSEKFNLTRFLGVILAFSGILIILFTQAGLPTHSVTPWVLSALITPISFAFCSVYIARYSPRECSSISLATGTLAFSSLILTPLVYLSGNLYQIHFPPSLPESAVLLEIILSSIGYILFFQLIKVAGPVYYSLINGIVAVTGLFWGMLLFHESLNQWLSLAVLLILFSLFLVNKRQQTMVESLSPA